jgi:hypothetical protein
LGAVLAHRAVHVVAALQDLAHALGEGGAATVSVKP